MASTPFTPPAWWLSGTNQNSIPANDNAMRFWISQADVDNTTTAQPASPTEGQCHIIQATHTGAQWSSFTPNDLVIFSGGTWYAFSPSEGNRVSVAGAVFIYTGGAWVAASGGGGLPSVAPVVSESGTNLDASAANAGNYTRFSSASAKSYTFDDGESFDVGAEYHGRNSGAADLTLVASGGFTLNPPAGGTLVVPQGGTFTVKVVSASEADVFGVTVAL